jgi:hypothetical protein
MHTLASRTASNKHCAIKKSRNGGMPSYTLHSPQRAIIRSILNSSEVQPKLTIGAPSDRYEQEADRVADQVMNLQNPKEQRQQAFGKQESKLQRSAATENGTPDIQRLCPECEKDFQRQAAPEEATEDQSVQTKPAPNQTPSVSDKVQSQIQSLEGSGQPLPHSEREYFEPRFGFDFSNVRIHTDVNAAESAHTIGATAYTIGRHIVFGDSQFTPGTRTGQQLIAHELTHAVQQSGTDITVQRKPSKTVPLNVKAPFEGRILSSSELKASKLRSKAYRYTGQLEAKVCDIPDPAKAHCWELSPGSKVRVTGIRMVPVLEKASGIWIEGGAGWYKIEWPKAPSGYGFVLGVFVESLPKAEKPPTSESPEETKPETSGTPATEAPKPSVPPPIAAPVPGVSPPTPSPLAILDMTAVLSMLRDSRRKGSLQTIIDNARHMESGKHRVIAASLAVKNEVLATGSRIPEEMAELRKLLTILSKKDRGTILAQFPDAAVPVAPTVPVGGIPIPPGSPYAALPKPLLDTLYLSFADRMIGMPNSRENLDNAFWGSRPRDIWDALLAMGSGVKVVKQIYERWLASGVSWSHVRSIRNVWSGTSIGFNFNSMNVSLLRKEVESSNNFCRDTLGGELYHALFEASAPCWREVVKPNTPGLHFCLGGKIPSVHIDPHQVVEFREKDDGSCNYDWKAVREHYKDLGWL